MGGGQYLNIPVKNLPGQPRRIFYLLLGQARANSIVGRFETLNADTQDLVNCLLPALAADFHVPSALNVILEDIRMRAWDCERRDHIKDQTENDPRNWGVQFLKYLKSIARLNGGNLKEFHERLRAKVDEHEAKHPWCHLNDIKAIKDDYEHPDRPTPQSDKGRRKRGNHEIYETRLQLPRKQGRLRRAEDGTLYRKAKDKRRKVSESIERTPERSTPGRRINRAIQSDDEDLEDLRARPQSTPAISDIANAVSMSNETLEVQKLQAELEVAEAELKAARLKYQYIQAKGTAERNGVQ
ncbi:hypothetical protein SLS61_008196 [Didymella pomorum]